METLMNEAWAITDDNAAEWALAKIRENNAERDRLIAVCNNQIDFYITKKTDYVHKCDTDNAFLESALHAYFETVPHKATKTQESYKLPSGTLKLKTPAPEWKHDDEKLMAAYPDFVENTPKLKWGDLKKRLTDVGNGAVIDPETGEVVQGVVIEARDPQFVVEV